MGDQLHDGVAPRPAEPGAAADPAEDRWVEKEARLINQQGLHAYPAHVVAHVANCFNKSDVLIRHGDREVDAKSVIMLLGLSSEYPLERGASLTVRARGVNAKTAAAVLAAVLASGFGED